MSWRGPVWRQEDVPVVRWEKGRLQGTGTEAMEKRRRT